MDATCRLCSRKSGFSRVFWSFGEGFGRFWVLCRILPMKQRLLSSYRQVSLFLIFKLEEEENLPLLLLLPVLYAGDCIFGSAFGLRCWLVVAIAQAIQS
jgi:hypothetical protein